MLKNVAGQTIGAQMTSVATGSEFAGVVTVYLTPNGGSQVIGSVGSGVCTHEGNGFHSYSPSQAETNYDHVAFTFKGTGAITSTVQAYPDASVQEVLTTVNAIQSSLAGLTVTVTGYASIDTDGVLQLKRAHTATLTFTSVSSNLVPDLSVANTKVFLGIKDAAGREWLSIEGTVLVATGLQSVRFTITAALAAAIPKGTHFFDVIAVYGYNSSASPPYTSLVPFTSGRANVTDIYLDPLDL